MSHPRMSHFKRAAALFAVSSGTLLQLGNCNISDYVATTSVTVDPRAVISSLVKGLIIAPVEDLIDRGIDYVFDKLEGDNAA